MQFHFVFFAVLLGPVWSTTDDYLDKMISVTQCHAFCLDEFSATNKNVENCKNVSSCYLCRETCTILFEKGDLWRAICSHPDICLTGCDKACSFVHSGKNKSVYPLARMFLSSVYDLNLDQFTLEWAPNFNINGERSVLYSILLKDENGQWKHFAQTTSQAVHVKRPFIHWDTAFRVIAVDSRSKVSDNETSFINSYINGTKFPKKEANTKISGKNLWKPQLESMVLSDTSAGLLTTITWPLKSEDLNVNHYELSWNVIDDSMEITGHLHTSHNNAIVTLWPNSVYSIQVISYTSEKILLSQSEPLIIDTRDSKQTAAMICKAAVDTTPVLAYAIITGFFATVTIATFTILLRNRRVNSRTESQDNCFGRESKGTITSPGVDYQCRRNLNCQEIKESIPAKMCPINIL